MDVTDKLIKTLVDWLPAVCWTLWQLKLKVALEPPVRVSITFLFTCVFMWRLSLCAATKENHSMCCLFARNLFLSVHFVRTPSTGNRKFTKLVTNHFLRNFYWYKGLSVVDKEAIIDKMWKHHWTTGPHLLRLPLCSCFVEKGYNFWEGYFPSWSSHVELYLC